MFLVDNLLKLIVLGPAKGVVFLGRQVAKEMEAQGDEGSLHARLFQLQLELDRGDICEEEYLEAEDSILERLEWFVAGSRRL